MIRILVVEDRPEVRYGLQMRLAVEADMQVVGLAADGSVVLDLVEELSPDVVLMDIEMPGQDGIDTSWSLQQSHPGLPVVLLSIHDDTLTLDRAARARVAGLVSKEQPVDCLLAAIRDAASRGQVQRSAWSLGG